MRDLCSTGPIHPVGVPPQLIAAGMGAHGSSGTVSRVPGAVAIAVLGHHPARVADLPGDDWFDAVDLLVRDESGAPRIIGFRTSDYVTAALSGGDPPWRRGAPGSSDSPGDYRPLAIHLDPATVRHWDFGQVLWIGPSEHPCLVWSNAEALSVRGLRTLLGSDPAPVRSGRLLDGPDGAGLPSPGEAGVEVPADLVWIDYSP